MQESTEALAGETVTSAIELSNRGMADLDADRRFISVNSAYLAMLGRQEKDLLGQPWHITVHPDDRERVEEAYRLARAGGFGYAEIRALRHDESVVYQALTVTGITGPDGSFTGYHCLRQDLSGYRRDQELLLLALESAPNGLLVLEADGRIRSVNGAVEKLFGYSRNELVGRTVETLLPERFRARHLSHRETFNATEAMTAMAGRDLSGLRKDGVEIPLQVYLNRIESDTGKLILCTILDIAERVGHERQLRLAKQAAESANRAKSDFLARMSHEIRTPMNLIMGMNALLLESPLDEKQRQHVEISYRNVRRLLRLINGILDLAKVEAGKLTLEAAPFDITELLEDCAATLASHIKQKGLQFEWSVDPLVWPYWTGDAERLQQVLVNLIGNAVKFTAQGKIEVRIHIENGMENGTASGTETGTQYNAEPRADSHAEHGAASDAEGGDPQSRMAYEVALRNHSRAQQSNAPQSSGRRRTGLRFEVTDTGCGVPPDKAAMIFEAFQQAEGAMDRPYEGTGLGLAIAKTLVEMMSGRIWVEPRTGPGSKFVFTAFFPQATQAEVLARRATMTRTAPAAEDVNPEPGCCWSKITART
jgi:PAS domain S-box-containing protein